MLAILLTTQKEKCWKLPKLVKVVKRLKNGQLPGDEVVAEMLKAGGEAVVQWLFDI